ncbi:MAG: hypothetical protein M1598_05710 [Actinobacteria bacterium]|nr:hypothetical protein [Actinomycetota bacterium]
MLFQDLDKLGSFQRSEIIMVKDLKEQSFDSLLNRIRSADSHALLVKYRRGDEDVVLIEGKHFESLAATLKQLKARLEELEAQLEEREIATELSEREVTETTDWRSSEEFEVALRKHRPKTGAPE